MNLIVGLNGSPVGTAVSKMQRWCRGLDPLRLMVLVAYVARGCLVEVL